MELFTYLAYSEKNLEQVINFCNKFGYYPKNEEELASCLQNIVAVEGESAFKELMELHPDKEVILELFEKKVEDKPMERERSRDCSCMMNADGGATIQNPSHSLASQTNTIILVSALIVAIAIISMKK